MEIPWDRIERQADGCWLWTGPRIRRYGQWSAAYNKGYSRLAHRAIYQIVKGEVPRGKQLDHLCKTPLCVNPDHLEPVTGKENIHRHHGIKDGKCKRGHPWVESNLIQKKGGVQCRACNLEKQREWRERKRKERALQNG